MIRLNLSDAIAMSDLAGSKFAAIVVCDMTKPRNKQIMSEDGKKSGTWNNPHDEKADVLVCLCHFGPDDKNRIVRAGKILDFHATNGRKGEFEVDYFRTIAITTSKGINDWCGQHVQQCAVGIELGSEAKSFDERVGELLKTGNIDELRRRIANENPTARLIESTDTRSRRVRSPHVVALALLKAKGQCSRCKKFLEFKDERSGYAFLEVHHRIPLALDGKDNEENTEALCPNCHRFAHYELRRKNNGKPVS